MQDLLSGQIKLSEVLVNRLIEETEYGAVFRVILVGDDTVNIKFAKPICSISEVALRMEKLRHDTEGTMAQFRVEEVVSKNIFVKPLFGALKSKLIWWLVPKTGSARLPKGIRVEVSDDRIAVEMRQWLRATAIGETQFPVVETLLETSRVSSFKILKGAIVLDISLENINI